jgi:hypothetical protein
MAAGAVLGVGASQLWSGRDALAVDTPVLAQGGPAGAAPVCPPPPPPAAALAPPAPPPAAVCPALPASAASEARPGRLPAPASAEARPVVPGREAVLPPPPALSAEHAKMLTAQDTRPTLPELHARLLAEPKDPNWSADAEQLIRRDLAAANESGEFDIPTVECRATVCELLAFGSAPDSPQKWNRALGELRKPWEAAGLVSNSTSISGANGRFVIVSILERPRKP